LEEVKPVRLSVGAVLELPREVRFKTQLPGSFAAGPMVHENSIYAASRDGVLYRLDPSSEQGLRSFSTTSLSGTLARPLPTPRGVVLTVLEGAVFLIESANDQLRTSWRVDLGETLRVDPVLLEDSVACHGVRNGLRPVAPGWLRAGALVS
jgi:outer membrane protein assembly factor BamB